MPLAFFAGVLAVSKKTLRLLLALFFLLGPLFARAGVEPFTNSIHGRLKAKDTLVVRDEKFRSTQFDWALIERQSVRNYVTFGFFKDSNAVLPKTFGCEVRLRVEYLTSPDQAEPLSKTVTLQIRYDRDSLGKNKQQDIYTFENAHWIKVTIEEIKSREFSGDMPPFLQLTSQIVAERKYKFQRERSLRPVYAVQSRSDQKFSGQPVAPLANSRFNSSNTSAHEINLTWTSLPGDEEFDVEWTALDLDAGYNASITALELNQALPDETLNALFRHKATRITTQANNHDVTLAHYNSYLFFRVRAVHYDAATGLRLEGPWDYQQTVASGNVYAVFNIQPYWHEPGLNWQFTATYAEEGKKKEVIGYFDGSLRSRQTLTYDNATENLVLQETIYDKFGRAAAAILPAPIKATVLKYYQAQSLNMQGDVYSYHDLDDHGDRCGYKPGGLLNEAGASLYYSEKNEFLGQEYFNYFIPHAENFPLAITQFTPDQTGRVRQQGGVGAMFQPDPSNNRTTRYFYGKPYQEELDALFGNDAGYAEHYLKNMVVDANGQISISYVDASGKTVATALSGESPASMTALNTLTTPQAETIQLLQPQQFQRDYTNLTLKATTTYLASVAGPVTLGFDIERLVYTYAKEDWQICSNCYYEVTIRIVNDCGETIDVLTAPAIIGSAVANCNLTGVDSRTYNLNFPKIGEYHVTFDMKMSRQVMETYLDTYINERKIRGDWKTEFRFVKEFLEKEDFRNCFSDCRTCERELGTPQQFLANAKKQLQDRVIPQNGAEQAEFESYIAALYQTLMAECEAKKPDCMGTPCDRYKKLMMLDVSPGGQYALFLPDGNPLETELNVLLKNWRGGPSPVFPVLSASHPDYQAALITLDDGTATSPYDQNFTLALLVTYWKDEWAEKFLPFHPEYCKLQFCYNNTAYYKWDQRVQGEILRVADIPLHPATHNNAYQNGVPAWLQTSDPFFTQPASPGYPLRDAMRRDLEQFASRVLRLNAGSEKSLTQVVDFQLYCADVSGNTNTGSVQNNWNDCIPQPSCRLPDREWEMYRDYYFELKEKYYDLAMRATTCSSACQVGGDISVGGSCPAKTEFAILGGDGTCDAGQKSIRIISSRGPLSKAVTLTLSYGGVTLPNLPTSVVIPAGQSGQQVCINEAVPLSAIYITAVSCSPSTATNNCPFGVGGSLYLPQGALQTGANTYETPDYSSGVRMIYTIVPGTANQPPTDSLYCPNGRSQTFYNCLNLYLPGISVPVQYFNVWVITCQQSLCEGSPEYYMWEQRGTYQFYAEGHNYYIQSLNGGTPAPCPNPDSNEAVPCLRIFVESTGTWLHFYNATISWCPECNEENLESVYVSQEVAANTYEAPGGTYYLFEGTGPNTVPNIPQCPQAVRSWHPCLIVNIDGDAQVWNDVTVFFCPDNSGGCGDWEGEVIAVNSNPAPNVFFSEVQEGCDVYATTYYVYPGNSDQPPANLPSCEGELNFYSCITFDLDGTPYTYTNAWVYTCYAYSGCAPPPGGLEDGAMLYRLSSEPIGEAVLVKKGGRRHEAKAELKRLIKEKEPKHRYYVDYTDHELFLVAPDSVKNNKRVSPRKKSGFTDWQFKRHFSVRIDSTRYLNLGNRFVAVYRPKQQRKGKMVTSAMRAMAASSSNPSPSCPATPHFTGVLTGTFCSIFAQNDGQVYTITTANGQPIPSGSYAEVRVMIDYPSGSNEYQNVYMGGGATSFSLCIDNASLQGASGIHLCSEYAPHTAPGNCSPLLLLKSPRFTAVSYNVPGFNVNEMTNEGLQQLLQQVQTSCATQVNALMAKLESCPTVQPLTAAQKASLRQKLINVCVKGGDIEHPYGASTTRPGENAGGYTSFAGVLRGELGIALTELCNPWLIESPYPWERQPQLAEVTLTKTNPAICAKIALLRQQYTLANPGISFYAYLQNRFGSEQVIISEADLSSLENSCSNCRYLLPKAIRQPVFLDPKAQGCITKTDWDAAVSAFAAEFGQFNYTSPYYGDIFSTYLNHRWGFTLTYDQYDTYQARLAMTPDLTLCNEPVYSTVEIPLYQCVNSLFANAITNGQRAYEEYVEVQKRQFRLNYLNTCMAVRSKVKLTQEKQDYHYTLYYYDQGGNLARTVPPDGVQPLLDPSQIGDVDKHRQKMADALSYDGPLANTEAALTANKLAEAIGLGTARTIEWWSNKPVWLSDLITSSGTYNGGANIFQLCQSGGQISVQVVKLIDQGGGSYTVDVVNRQSFQATPPFGSWTHFTILSNNYHSGAFTLYVNGSPLTPLSGNPLLACATTYTSGQTLTQLPSSLNSAKHLRIYSRGLTLAEIRANAEHGAMGIATPELRSNLLFWGRYNTPNLSLQYVFDPYSTIEINSPVVDLPYPEHRLHTTYHYNTMGQLVWQSSPDGGTSQFWYDRLGRLVASQNEEQQSPTDGESPNRFSYTKYDNLGRIVEVGEKVEGEMQQGDPGVIHEDQTLQNFYQSGALNRQITATVYDEPAPIGAQGLDQQHLRKRVAASFFIREEGQDPEQGTYYSYDLAGNVKSLWQQVQGLELKRIDYEYDLVSGKVNMVRYQHGTGEKFYYQYEYDQENKIRRALSGTDATWNPTMQTTDLRNLPTTSHDAEYFYYRHGPLARAELGHRKVQGLDYAYTLQGWLKGINGHKLIAEKEMGRDGQPGTDNEWVGRDVFGFGIGYYEGDYRSIDAQVSAFDMSYVPNPSGDETGHPLYNGNISHTTVALSKFRGMEPVGYTYRYDQLNRLVAMRHHELANSTTQWDKGSVNDQYREDYEYDGNGNIQRLVRNGHDLGVPKMDDLFYHYYPGTNRLRYVHDDVPDTDYPDHVVKDVERQDDHNYEYDKIGNLVKDYKEDIDKIWWTVYGKIEKILKEDGTEIVYSYDASGNRVRKFVENRNTGISKVTYYIRDAQGNTLAVYEGDEKVEQHLYGSSRIGIWRPRDQHNGEPYREYEITNHLGNVVAVISDRLLEVDAGGDGAVDYYDADVLVMQDYYPFGMVMPERKYSAASGYRYGFNGKEADNEVKGEGNQQDYGMRIYDPRLGKFLSVDPLTKTYPMLTPYQFAGNGPISGVDLDGLEYYYAADGRFLGQGSDPKNMEVRLARTDGVSKTGKNLVSSVDLNNKAVKNWVVIHNNHDEFKKMTAIVYAEASNKPIPDEAAGIVSVLENRAAYENTSVLAQMTVAKGVNGASDAGRINREKGPNADAKRQAVTSGVIKALVSSEDFSKGAFYWDGIDFNPANEMHGGYTQRYTPGFIFTDPAHDLYGLGSNIDPNVMNGTGYNAKYESTNAIGKTTFSKLTDDYRDAQYPDKVDKQGNVTEKRYGKKVGSGYAKE